VNQLIRYWVALGVVCSGLWGGSFCASAFAAEAVADPMVIRYHSTPGHEFHHGYHQELIERILVVTRPEFGDYKIHPYGKAPTAKRQARLLSEGKLLNIQWAPPGSEIAKAKVTPIAVDILQGLQGYRVCLINSHAAVDFKGINSAADLKRLRIAQGASWAELPIYYFNDIKPIELPVLEGLYPMLGLKRFDCLPLGVNEITTLYHLEKSKYPFLAIEPSLLIYYEFPIYFYVSQQTPELAKRISLGLQKLTESGELDNLFRRYHQQNYESLHLYERRIICLKSPLVATEQQCLKPLLLPAFMR
jgi:ABC-type amino acid transport substrate-binding protein